MPRRGPTFEFTNLRVCRDGYQVVITRKKKILTKFFVGHTEESLQKAELYRDNLLRALKRNRKNPIPPRVYRALGLNTPLVGVSRNPKRGFYQVPYRDADGRMRVRTFSWKRQNETDAYAEAVEFRLSLLDRLNLRKNSFKPVVM